ncbi:MAG TPA: hypothetical protein VET66_12725 [Steroidobacteraceae bacterium]|nr:hypothetical protein [Candidatus Dormibacteraeota bacterium]HYM29008.1 hypothetical protein [Steroidobacteraceae bacterium]
MAYQTSSESERVSGAGTAGPEPMHGTTGAGIHAEPIAEEAGGDVDARLRSSTASGLDSAAGAVHAGGERVASAAHRAGDALASGAAYVRDHDVRDMVDDLAEVVRNNPGPALLCAAALGFVLGRSVYRH